MYSKMISGDVTVERKKVNNLTLSRMTMTQGGMSKVEKNSGPVSDP
jgi:hypothetical protein